MSQLNFLALELTHIVYLFFVLSSHSLDCNSCAVKKCAIPLSEPLVDHRPRTEMVSKKLMYSGGRGGIVIVVANYT